MEREEPFLSEYRVEELLLSQCWYIPDFIAKPKKTFRQIMEVIQPTQHFISLYGKSIAEPRYNQVFSTDTDLTYGYSRSRKETHEFPEILEAIRVRLNTYFAPILHGYEINTCLANLYRDGNDHISWHSDSERDLIPGLPIISISLGPAERTFYMKTRNEVPEEQKHTYSILLARGSCIVMGAGTQQSYLHCIKKDKAYIPVEGVDPATLIRLNLTFRVAKRKQKE